MELFNEVKNRYFQLVFRLINECAGGREKGDIIRIIDEGEFEQKVIGKNQQSFADLILNRGSEEDNLNLLTQRQGRFYPAVEAGKESESILTEKSDRPPLPVRFTKLEKAWLKALIEEPEIEMLLSGGALAKLQKELEEVDSPIKREYFELTNNIKLPEPDNQAKYKENFRLLLEALLQEKPVRYSNTDRNRRLYENRLALPVAIEYSLRDARFRVSMYSIEDKRPIMANIHTLSHLRMTDEEVGIDRKTAKQLLYEEKYSDEPVVLEVRDEKAAMERCFMCFSGMERTAREIGRNQYEIKLNYYLFEEENLISNIISLGPYVKVISPNRIADEIIRRVRKSISMYQITSTAPGLQQD